MDASVLETAVERTPLAGHVGKSGALLERVVLADGSHVVVKRFDPADDLVMRVTGDTRGREVDLFRRGLLSRLPQEVGHAVLGGWFEAGHGVLVMRDLGESTLGWDDRMTAERCRILLRGLTSLHRAFHGRAPDGLVPLEPLVGLFEPARITPYAGNELVDLALLGWQRFADVAPDEVGGRVLALAEDTTPLVRALRSRPATMTHGDLATVNMAFEGSRLTLIDWGLAAAAPGALDIGRFLAGCAHVLDLSKDEFLGLYRAEAGDLYDERATQLGLLAGLVWLGWNKALDIVEHPDATVRERERDALTWWLARAAEAFETFDL